MSGHLPILFVLCCAFLLYVTAGYPLLLKLLSKFARKPVRKGEWRPTVSLVIPVHNAEAYLHRKLDSVLSQDYPRELLDVLVIDAASSDDTASIAAEYAAWDVRLLSLPKPGKAAAMNAASRATRSQILVFSDVWQISERGSLREMMKCFADPAVGMVSGEVIMHGRDGGSTERNLGMFAQIEGWFTERLSDVDSLLGSSGPFFAIRRPLMPQIPTDSLLDDLYVAMAVFFRGFRVVVEPAATTFDNAIPVETELGDKIKVQAGDYQIMKQYPGLLSSRDRMRFHYLSYKVGRLLLPFVLILLAASTYQLQPKRLMIAAAVTQVIFYLLALIHPLLGENFFLKRVSAAAHTFALTMIASLCAVVVLFVPVRKIWTDLGAE
jgi:cellulose synthase/poly-beta-1,6-N-acetylglucosamine synthase-like glycosyltransferase